MGGQKNIPYNCQICGKDFFINRATYNKLISGKYKNTYCSKACATKAKMTGLNVECDNCGKIFYRKPKQILRHDLQFCSQKCVNEYRIKTHHEMRQCEMCNKEFYVIKTSTQRFCSIQCQGKWQSTQIHELNPRNQKQYIKCDYCDNMFWIKRYKISNFDKHFCCNDCKQNWYREIWSQQSEVKENSRVRAIEMLSKGLVSTVNSKPQQILDNILKENDIAFEREKDIKYYAIDNYLFNDNLFIEVQGDYWHCNPIKFNLISDIQNRVINRDRAKRKYVYNNYNSQILYLWENDLCNNTELCLLLVLEFIKNKGDLPNYNSFNYSILNHSIYLNDNIIHPYQELDYDSYKEKIIINNP